MAKKKQKRSAAPPPPVRKAPPRSPHAAEAAQHKRDDLVAAERAAASQRRTRLTVGALLVVGALVAVAAFVVTERRKDASLTQALTAGSCTVDEQADPKGSGDGHVSSPGYGVNPPAGGQHLPSAARAGVYAGSSVPADGLLVHSMEHGYIVLWHQPGVEAAALETLAADHPGDIIVAERASLPTPVAATAWGRRLQCGSVEQVPLQRFVDAYVGKGPENVQRG